MHDVVGVYSSLDELVRLQFAARGPGISGRQPPTSVLAGRRTSRLRGRGLTFEELRLYRPGDDVRSIDWRVTARTGKAHTRVYTEERERPVLLVVDQRLGMFYGTQTQMKSVTAVEFAALVAWQVLATGDRIGATVFNDAQLSEIDPHRSRATVLRLLDALVGFNRALSVNGGVEPSADQLDHVLTGVAARATHDWLIVIISDFQGLSESTTRHLRNIARHNDVIAALVHDPSAQVLPHRSRSIISDTRRQAEIDLSDSHTREVLLDQLRQRQSFLQTLRRELGVPCLALDTRGDVATQLANQLGQVSR